jgi:hypothetical protein
MVQMKNNIHSFEMQTDKFVEHFRNVIGCTARIITIADDEALSGTIPLQDRPGMVRTLRLINGQELIDGRRVKWIAAVHVNRFTRDPWLIDPAVLMKTCHANDVWVATLRMFFNFQDPYCQRVFMMEAEESARHLEWMKLILGGGKSTASDNGYYDGRFLVPGYIVDRTDPLRKKYKVYKPHAEIVHDLAMRFFELGGNFPVLKREVAAKPYVFPKFEDWVDQKDLARFCRLKKIEDGIYKDCYIVGEGGLRSILCNEIYIGWWVPLAGGLVENNHEPILEGWLFTYCHEHLSRKDLEGNRRRPPRQSRYSGDQGLLRNVLRDKRDNRVYAQYINTRQAASYRVSQRGEGRLIDTYEFSVLVNQLDDMFLEKFFERIKLLEKIEGWKDKLTENLEKKQKSREERKQNLQKSIREADFKMLEIQDTINTPGCPKALKLKSFDDYNELGKVKAQYEEQLRKMDDPEEMEDEEATLYEIHTLVPRIKEEWPNLAFNTKLRFIGALVQKVVITEEAPSWLGIQIHWKEAIGDFADVGCFPRGGCNRSTWTAQEDAILYKMYPEEDASIIINALPERSWRAIMARAEKLEIKRDRSRRPNTVHASYGDLLQSAQKDRSWLEKVAELGVSPSVSKPQWYRPWH